ncbi:MAG: GNAT family N-acetyltransferase [Planctomycetaceae bacterium]|nr:GNAT family N-acetyltransferase [Planctomycetaceae bacterium]MCB9950734.1 GNAT family N-acetyltransferase [Planctomycetaceae bacterium]
MTLVAEPKSPTTSSPTHAVGQTSLRWHTFTSSEATMAMSAWQELAHRLQSTGLTDHPDWVSCWLKHYGKLVPHHFLAAFSGEELRGITLLTSGTGQRNGPFTVDTVHLGTAGEPTGHSVVVEYNRPLVEPGFEEEFAAGVWAHLNCDLRWEQLRLDGIHANDLHVWQNLLPEADIRRRESSYFDFNAARESGKDLLSCLGSSTRSNIRRRLKKYGELETRWAETGSEAAEYFEELIELHQARWQSVGQPGAFASKVFLDFQRDAVIRLVESRRGVVFRVRHEGETVGCLFLLNDRNRLLDYLSGFADFQAKPSIGLVSHYLCMEAALARGFDDYDFLVGEKQHKQNLSNNATEICWLTWTRPSWKSRCIDGLRSAKRLIDRIRGKQPDSPN